MSKEEIEGLLGVKKWLQGRLSDIREEKERLTTLLEAVDRVLEELPSVGAKPKPELTLVDIKDRLGSELTEALDISQKETVVVIRRKRFLEREVWHAVTENVRQLNGRWISAGEDSRWEIELA